MKNVSSKSYNLFGKKLTYFLKANFDIFLTNSINPFFQ
ncbi:hypothetical protein OKW21_002051 [Catalinimonas alkaloidigena]|nr:hypothetical protein [Catalinimonas alkaloidigena]